MEGFRIKFEYPDTWRREALETYDEGKGISFIAPDSNISIFSDVTIPNGGDYKDASGLIQHELDRGPFLLEFYVVSHNKTQLGGVEGEDIVFSYRFKFTDRHAPIEKANVDKIVVERILAVDYQGRIYGIMMLADIDKYDQASTGFEHLIATFHFLN